VVPEAPLPAALEVAAFRIASEAMTNVVRPAGATRCLVSAALNGSFQLIVRAILPIGDQPNNEPDDEPDNEPRNEPVEAEA
jgi:signal transduction histidine kinase